MSLPDAVARAVRRRLAAVQAEARLPSLSAAVERAGDLATAGIGGSPEPTPDTQYRIGSITKTFTAVLVLQLRDEGRVRLDDPLDEHVPGTAVGRLSVLDLLGHLSGLRREPAGPFWEASPGLSAEQLLSELHADDVLLPTRRAWHYSNVAYGLLGQVVERLRGTSYERALRRFLLDPLDLSQTTYAPRAPYATGLRVHPFTDTVISEPVHDTLAMAPAGQLWSTPGDLCRWGAFLAAPADEVLAGATVEEMCHPVVIADPDAWTNGAGLGLQLFRRGERVLVGHGGSMPGFGAGLAVSRGAGVAAAVCANAWQALDGAALACDLVLEVLEGDPAAPAPWTPAEVPAGLTELTGLWWWRGVGLVASVSGGALLLGPVAAPRGPRSMRYERVADDLFVGGSGMNHGEHLRVLRGQDGRVRHLDTATFLLTRDLDDPQGRP